ncbi:DUF2793 domain-containing protein [Erythrobacter sp. HA6-11]
MTDTITFSAKTPKLGLPNLFAGQAQKEFFFNEALGIIDGFWQIAIEGSSAAPPSTSAEGECWIVGASASGEWEGKERNLALRTPAGWNFVQPHAGMLVFDKSAGKFSRYDSEWNGANSIDVPQGGGVVDAEARTAIEELVAALRVLGVLPPA